MKKFLMKRIIFLSMALIIGVSNVSIVNAENEVKSSNEESADVNKIIEDKNNEAEPQSLPPITTYEYEDIRKEPGSWWGREFVRYISESWAVGASSLAYTQGVSVQLSWSGGVDAKFKKDVTAKFNFTYSRASNTTVGVTFPCDPGRPAKLAFDSDINHWPVSAQGVYVTRTTFGQVLRKEYDSYRTYDTAHEPGVNNYIYVKYQE